ncbi:hypothetical protein SAMN03159512_05218 [Pseudomonas sp. NFR09]|nr:hypothetical protein SAMN03159512_05218 [Pseudomonas sp. NFR09]
MAVNVQGLITLSKVLIACVWLLGSAYGAMVHATSVVFLNPGMSTETFRVSYAQFMQAGAKDLGLHLRVRYGSPAWSAMMNRPAT